jgi:hypothetical protein
MRKITFFTTVDGVQDVYPIIRAKDYRPNWITSAKDSYIKRKQKAEAENERFTHIYRCPGIFDLMSKGFIVPMMWDVIVETNGDGESFSWAVPSGELGIMASTNKVVEGHMARSIAETLPKRPGYLKSLVKFNSPWHIVAPPDVKFIIIAVPYPDPEDAIFEQVPGILDPGLSTELNPQGYWKILNGKHTVRAGTPMFQIIPLTDEEFELEVKHAGEKEIAWTKKRNYFFHLTFVFKRALMKTQYAKHFFGKN